MVTSRQPVGGVLGEQFSLAIILRFCYKYDKKIEKIYFLDLPLVPVEPFTMPLSAASSYTSNKSSTIGSL